MFLFHRTATFPLAEFSLLNQLSSIFVTLRAVVELDNKSSGRYTGSHHFHVAAATFPWLLHSYPTTFAITVSSAGETIETAFPF